MSVEQRTVEAGDLEPFGWVCEACDIPFAAGDVAYGRRLGHYIGDWRCAACTEENRPILEHGLRGHVHEFVTVRTAQPAMHQLAVLKFKLAVKS